MVLWYLACVITAWSSGYTILSGSDLWWHLAAGDFMVGHSGFIYTDPWSYTFEGRPWLNDAWLSDLIYHWWVAAFGLPSLAWWKWGLLVGTYLLLMRTLHRVSGDLFSAFVGTVLAAAVGEAFLDVRPSLYSFLGFSVLLSLTLGRPRPSWWLPLLFALWVQLHAVFVFGLMALAVLLVPGAIRGGPGYRKRSALIGMSCVLVCLINPNSIAVFSRPIRYAFSDSLFLHIGEWLPPFVSGGIHSRPYPLAIGVFAAGCALLLMRRTNPRDDPVAWSGMLIGALTLAMSLKSRRFVPLFGIAQSVVLATALAPVVRATLVRMSASARRRFTRATPVLALGLGALWLWPYPIHSYAFHYLVGEDSFPVDTVDFITRNQLSGKVFAYYNWGGYLDMRTQGAMKVYIDGRADMVFDEETYGRYEQVLRVQPGWLRIIEDSGPDYVLWPKAEGSGPVILRGLLDTGRWRLVYEDYVSRLLERRDRPVAEGLLPSPDTAWHELALADAARDRELSLAEAHVRRALELMPHLRAACSELVQVQALQGRRDAARQTMKHCDQVYPDRIRHDGLSAWLDRLPH